MADLKTQLTEEIRLQLLCVNYGSGQIVERILPIIEAHTREKVREALDSLDHDIDHRSRNLIVDRDGANSIAMAQWCAGGITAYDRTLEIISEHRERAT